MEIESRWAGWVGRVVAGLLLAATLSGCQTSAPAVKATPDIPATPASQAEEREAETVIAPEPEEKPAVRDLLTEEMVFAALAGELGLQRKQLAEARRYLLEAATLARDPVAAERAAKVALLEGRSEEAAAAVALWREIVPESLDALQLSALLAMRAGDDDAAIGHLQRVIEIGDAEGEEGFLSAMTVLVQDKKYPQAERLMKRLDALWPERVSGRYVLALLALLRKEHGRAETLIEDVLQQEPGNERAVALLARIRMAADDRAGARKALEAGLTNAPTARVLRASLARMLLEDDETEQAFTEYRRLVEQNPTDYDSTFILGVIALQLDRRAEAEQQFRELYDGGHKIQSSAFYLGWIAEEDERRDEALDWYHRVDSGTHRSDARQRMARLIAEEDLDAARELLRQLRMEVRGRDQVLGVWLAEAELLAEHAEEERVYAYYEKALESFPDDTRLLYSRAMYAIGQERVEILEADLRRVLEIDPEHAYALNALGYTLADRTDRYSEAKGYIEQAYALEPDSPAVLDSMGWVQFRLNNPSEAKKFLEQAYEQSQDAEIAAHLGEVLWVLDERARAREIWDAALEAYPDNDYLKQTLQRFQP